jgi:hypothetical protein
VTWFSGIAVICFLIWLLVVSPRFRIYAMIALLLAGGATWWVIHSRNEEKRTLAALIQPSEVELTDVILWNEYGSHKIVGTVRNLSDRHTLASFGLHITAFDCPNDAITQDCDTIGAKTVPVRVSVPPGQVRKFDESAYFTNLPRARVFKWSYTLQDVRAQAD